MTYIDFPSEAVCKNIKCANVTDDTEAYANLFFICLHTPSRGIKILNVRAIISREKMLRNNKANQCYAYLYFFFYFALMTKYTYCNEKYEHVE